MDTKTGMWLKAPYLWTKGSKGHFSRLYILPDDSVVYNDSGAKAPYGKVKTSGQAWYALQLKGSVDDCAAVRSYFVACTTKYDPSKLKFVGMNLGPLVYAKSPTTDDIYSMFNIDTSSESVTTVIEEIGPIRLRILALIEKLGAGYTLEAVKNMEKPELLQALVGLDVLDEMIGNYIENGEDIDPRELPTLRADAKSGYVDMLLMHGKKELDRRIAKVNKKIDVEESKYPELIKLMKKYDNAKNAKVKNDLESKIAEYKDKHPESSSLDRLYEKLDVLTEQYKKPRLDPAKELKVLRKMYKKLIGSLREYATYGINGPEDENQNLEGFVDDEIIYESDKIKEKYEEREKKYQATRQYTDDSSHEELLSDENTDEISVEESLSYSVGSDDDGDDSDDEDDDDEGLEDDDDDE